MKFQKITVLWCHLQCLFVDYSNGLKYDFFANFRDYDLKHYLSLLTFKKKKCNIVLFGTVYFSTV